jgi:hypothetical protein
MLTCTLLDCSTVYDPNATDHLCSPCITGWSQRYLFNYPVNPLTTVYFISIIYHSGPMDPNRIIWYMTLAKWLQCFISLLCCLLAIKVLLVMHLEFQLLFLYLKFLLRNYTTWHVHAEYYITADIIGVLR